MDLERDRWQAAEFARLSGVTVRTLHHYDRIGLLKPKRRTAKGFRLYGREEFARLQQISTLKFIGFSLTQIKEILGRRKFDLAETLRAQKQLVENKRHQLNLVLEAIKRAEKRFAKDNAADLENFQKIIEVMNMEQNMEWTKKYYSDAAQTKIEERKNLWTPELQEKVTADWAALVADIEAAMNDGTEPKSDRAQELAGRWKELVSGFTGGDPEIQKGLNKMYADEANWQTEWKKPFSDEVQDFIMKAMKE